MMKFRYVTICFWYCHIRPSIVVGSEGDGWKLLPGPGHVEWDSDRSFRQTRLRHLAAVKRRAAGENNDKNNKNKQGDDNIKNEVAEVVPEEPEPVAVEVLMDQRVSLILSLWDEEVPDWETMQTALLSATASILCDVVDGDEPTLTVQGACPFQEGSKSILTKGAAFLLPNEGQAIHQWTPWNVRYTVEGIGEVHKREDQAASVDAVRLAGQDILDTAMADGTFDQLLQRNTGYMVYSSARGKEDESYIVQEQALWEPEYEYGRRLVRNVGLFLIFFAVGMNIVLHFWAVTKRKEREVKMREQRNPVVHSSFYPIKPEEPTKRRPVSLVFPSALTITGVDTEESSLNIYDDPENFLKSATQLSL